MNVTNIIPPTCFFKFIVHVLFIYTKSNTLTQCQFFNLKFTLFFHWCVYMLSHLFLSFFMLQEDVFVFEIWQ